MTTVTEAITQARFCQEQIDAASKYLGLAEDAPRLAVSFAIFGLALVDLPGTLGFCSQDLLIHGALLPIATAMNAVSFFRLFTGLFLGKRRTGFTAMADALPRERWILTAGVLFVVFGGLFPNAVVIQHSSEADLVQKAIQTAADHSVLYLYVTQPVLRKRTGQPMFPDTLREYVALLAGHLAI
jgi:NADH:ubiquinone oxidoreductase subunit 4 (subunit M)